MQYHFDIMSNKPLWLSGTKKNLFWVNCIPFVFLSKLFRYNYVFVVKSNSKLHTLPMWAFNWSVIKAGLFDTVKLSFPSTQAINKNSNTRTYWSVMKGFGVGSGEFPCTSEGYMEDCCELGRNNFFKNPRFNNPSPGWVKRLNPKVVKLRPFLSHTYWKNLFPRR